MKIEAEVPLGRYTDPESRMAVSRYVDQAYTGLTRTQKEHQKRELLSVSRKEVIE